MAIRFTAVAVVLACLFAAPASASTISGRLAGKLPKAGKGFATVRAVDAKSLRIVGVDKVHSRRYKLKVPAGRYWMFAATTRLRGKPGVDRPGSKVAVRKGKRKVVALSLRKRKRRRPKLPPIPGLPSARAAFVTVKYPAVWVQHFAVSGPSEFRALRKGMADMLISDLGAPLKAACGGVLVEREQLQFLLTEQVISNPTRPPSTDKMIGANREVSGRVTVAGATTTLTVDVTNLVTGTTRSVTRSGATDRIFELETSVVQEVVRLICGAAPPGHYAGPVSGSQVTADGGSSQTLSWSGTVRQRFTGDVQSESTGDPPGEYALYETESGSIHLVLDGVDGDCTYHGAGDVTIVPNRGEFSRVQQGVDTPAYSLIATLPPDAKFPVTTSGPAHCGGGTSFSFGAGGRVIMGMGTGGTQRASSSTLVGTTRVVIGPVTVNWRWSLAPQAG